MVKVPLKTTFFRYLPRASSAGAWEAREKYLIRFGLLPTSIFQATLQKVFSRGVEEILGGR